MSQPADTFVLERIAHKEAARRRAAWPAEGMFRLEPGVRRHAEDQRKEADQFDQIAKILQFIQNHPERFRVVFAYSVQHPAKFCEFVDTMLTVSK